MPRAACAQDQREKQLDYPEDFNTSAFPAGRRVALSRAVGIWIAVSLFLIVFGCIAIPWLIKNRTIDPFVIYVDAPVGQWRLVGRSDTKRSISYYDAIQRALVGVFAENWFAISSDSDINDANWAQCSRAQVCDARIPSSNNGGTECGIYCLAGEDLYQNFKTKILPIHQDIADTGETWTLNGKGLMITPSGTVTPNGGMWTVRGRVLSDHMGMFDVIAYVTVARNIEMYPQTFGFYVTDFKAYRE